MELSPTHIDFGIFCPCIQERAAQTFLSVFRAFGDTLKLWFKHNLLSTPIKIRLYNTFVLPILTYNLACHGLSRAQEKRLDVFHRKQVRCTLGITYPDVISNADLCAVTGQCSVSEMAKRDRWKLLGHILRQPSDIPANVALTAFVVSLPDQYGSSTELIRSLPDVYLVYLRM